MKDKIKNLTILQEVLRVLADSLANNHIHCELEEELNGIARGIDIALKVLTDPEEAPKATFYEQALGRTIRKPEKIPQAPVRTLEDLEGKVVRVHKAECSALLRAIEEKTDWTWEDFISPTSYNPFLDLSSYDALLLGYINVLTWSDGLEVFGGLKTPIISFQEAMETLSGIEKK